MSNKQKIIYGVLLIVALGVAFTINFAIKYAYIGSSYDAKTVCSCMFVSGRELDNIKSEDLYAVPFANIIVDKEKQTVTADIYGFAETKAIYRKGLGCTLVNELSEEEIRKQPSIPSADTLTEKLSLSISTEIDKVTLDKILNAAFDEKSAEHIIRSRAIVVLHDGKLIAEKYAQNITAQTPLLGWSMTKSVTNAMIGMMVKDGKIDIKKAAPINEWKKDRKSVV